MRSSRVAQARAARAIERVLRGESVSDAAVACNVAASTVTKAMRKRGLAVPPRGPKPGSVKPDSKTQRAVHLVTVRGLTPRKAAAKVGVSRQAVEQAIRVASGMPRHGKRSS